MPRGHAAVPTPTEPVPVATETATVPTAPTAGASPISTSRAGASTGQRASTLAIVVVTALGGVWRLAYTLVSKGRDKDLFDEGDAFFYSAVANNLARGRWYLNPFNGRPAADHPPLTVLVLGPASRLFSNSVLAQRLTMTLVGTLVVAAVGLLARRVAGPVAGVAAAVVAAANPNLWMNDAVVMSEAISALLIVALLAAGFWLARRPTMGRAAGAGAVCGLTVLARAEMGLFLPLMIAPVVLTAGALTWSQRLARLALAAGLTVAVVAPWSLWSTSRFEEPVLVSTNDGTTLLGANCPATYSGTITGGWSLRCVLDSGAAGLDASQLSARQRRLAVDNIRANRGRLPVVLLAREGRTFGFWRPDQQAYANQGEGRPRWATWAGFVTFWALVPFTVAGTVVLRRRGTTVAPILAAAVTVVLVSGLFYGIPRFRLPLDVAMPIPVGVIVAAAIGSRAPTARLSRRYVA